MPVQVFTSINDLVAYVAAELPTNGNQEITAARHREVMQSTILSLMNIVSSLPPEMVLDYPAWDSEETYAGASEVIVRHNGKLWLFVSGTEQTGVEPGGNFTVWSELGAVQAAHLRNGDTMLAQGTASQVSAAEVRAALDAPKRSTGVFRPIDSVGPPDPWMLTGYRFIVTSWDEEFAPDFEGRLNNIAEKTATGWSFEVPVQGDRVYTKVWSLNDPVLSVRIYLSDGWHVVHGLQGIVEVANGHTGSTPLKYDAAPVMVEGSFSGDLAFVHPVERKRIVEPGPTNVLLPVSSLVMGYSRDLVLIIENWSGESCAITWPGELRVADDLALPESIEHSSVLIVRILEVSEVGYCATSVQFVNF